MGKKRINTFLLKEKYLLVKCNCYLLYKHGSLKNVKLVTDLKYSSTSFASGRSQNTTQRHPVSGTSAHNFRAKFLSYSQMTKKDPCTNAIGDDPFIPMLIRNPHLLIASLIL